MEIYGVELIHKERERQISVEGYSAEHDDKLEDGQLAIAGAAFVLHDYNNTHLARGIWPLDPDKFKPKSRLRNLIRAGALIAAEIDRLQRNQPESAVGVPD